VGQLGTVTRLRVARTQSGEKGKQENQLENLKGADFWEQKVNPELRVKQLICFFVTEGGNKVEIYVCGY
jgi:hypothetical protein